MLQIQNLTPFKYLTMLNMKIPSLNQEGIKNKLKQFFFISNTIKILKNKEYTVSSSKKIYGPKCME